MERQYNDTAQKIDTYNNQIITDFEQMRDIQNMHVSKKIPYRDQKRPKLPISDAWENFIFEYQKIPEQYQNPAKYPKYPKK